MRDSSQEEINEMTYEKIKKLTKYGEEIRELLDGYSSKIITPIQYTGPFSLIISGKEKVGKNLKGEFLKYFCGITKMNLEIESPFYEYKITPIGKNPVLITSEVKYIEKYKRDLNEIAAAKSVEKVNKSNIFLTPDAFKYKALGNEALNRMKGMISSPGINPAETNPLVRIPFIITFVLPEQNDEPFSINKEKRIKITQLEKSETTDKILIYLHSLFL